MNLRKYFKKNATAEQKRKANKIEAIGGLFGFIMIVWFAIGWILVDGDVAFWLYPLPVLFILFIIFAFYHIYYISNVVQKHIDDNSGTTTP